MLPPKSPQQQPASTPSPLTPTQTPAQMPTYSPRDLQRQQEVRDWLSGKPGATAGALITEIGSVKRRLAGPALLLVLMVFLPEKLVTYQFITA